MKTAIMKIYLIVIITPLTFSQWESGFSYKIKNEVPQNGIGLMVSRNLPFQRPSFGIKIRGEINLFRQTETENILGKNIDINYLSEDYHVDAVVSLFYRNFSPYFGFGFGYGQMGGNRLSGKGALLILFAGLSFPVSFINLYIEIQGVNYFFDSFLPRKDISSLQFRGAVGISFSITTLRY